MKAGLAREKKTYLELEDEVLVLRRIVKESERIFNIIMDYSYLDGYKFTEYEIKQILNNIKLMREGDINES